MEAEQAAALYTMLDREGIRFWLDGGWGIDALLGEQTRPHKDLDALVNRDDLPHMLDVLVAEGFTLKELWSENVWTASERPVALIGRQGATGNEVATAFVLWHPDGRELDFHVFLADAAGVLALWEGNVDYTAEAFSGRGTIAGTPVRCLSAAMQMATHTGYVLLDKDRQDLRHLHERFGVPYVNEEQRG